MLRIGEFSKLAMTTVKTLRYYDEVGLLKPLAVDPFTGYRTYEASQLNELHLIQALRQAGLSVTEVAEVVSGGDAHQVLTSRADELRAQIARMQDMLSRTEFILRQREEGSIMSYTATIKHIPGQVIYCKELTMRTFADYFAQIPALGQEVSRRYPLLKCAHPEYSYSVNLDHEWRDSDNRILYCEAVDRLEGDFDGIRFLRTEPLDVVAVMHKGAYEDMGPAFAYALEWAEANGYEVAGDPRASFIDGIWNKDDESEWLTEIQVPVTR